MPGKHTIKERNHHLACYRRPLFPFPAPETPGVLLFFFFFVKANEGSFIIAENYVNAETLKELLLQSFVSHWARVYLNVSLPCILLHWSTTLVTAFDSSSYLLLPPLLHCLYRHVALYKCAPRQFVFTGLVEFSFA